MTAGDVRLPSRSAIPAEVSPDNCDHRRLGIAVARITLDGRPIALADPRLGSGWHEIEPGWRWTNGDAGVLEIEVAMTER